MRMIIMRAVPHAGISQDYERGSSVPQRVIFSERTTRQPPPCLLDRKILVEAAYTGITVGEHGQSSY